MKESSTNLSHYYYPYVDFKSPTFYVGRGTMRIKNLPQIMP